MKKKVIGIIIATLIICNVVPATSYILDDEIIIIKNPNLPPPPGHMNEDTFDLFTDYTAKIKKPYNNKIQSTINNNIISLIQNIDETLYLGFLENLTAFGPRLTTTQACEDAGEYIYNEFIKMDLEARYQEWTHNSLFGNNIEATLPGIDSSSDEIYIICAHYDTVSGSPGADDDGSGVAAVLTAAEVMSSYSFNHTIKFVAFSGEEQGLYGSRYYVEEAVSNNDNIIATLNADMIGFAESENDESKLKVFYDDQSEWLTTFTTDISQEYYDYLELEIIPGGYSWGSDHYYFWQAGYDALFYFEYNFNDYYHSPQDTIENMNIQYAVKSTKLIISTLGELSEITESSAPLKPDTPTGSTNGKAGVEYTYTTSTIDLDGNIIYYYWDWGDNTSSGWIGPFESGDEANAANTWDIKGDYSIKVKAKDDNGYESSWSDPLPISMPKNKSFKQFYTNILERYPLIFTILRKIMHAT
jgi:hypothetical protein